MGGIAGLALGLAVFAVCQLVASRIEKGPNAAKSARAAKAVRTAGLVVLVTDTIIGYMVGPMVLAG
jgi:hypothetical protein